MSLVDSTRDTRAFSVPIRSERGSFSCFDAFSSREPGSTSLENALADRFRHEANPEHRLLGFVQKLHLPFGILLQAARNAAEKVAADLGHLGPGRLAALEFGSLIGRACVATMADPEKIQRHDWAHVLGPLPAFVGWHVGSDSLPSDKDGHPYDYGMATSQRSDPQFGASAQRQTKFNRDACGRRVRRSRAAELNRSSGAIPGHSPTSPARPWSRI